VLPLIGKPSARTSNGAVNLKKGFIASYFGLPAAKGPYKVTQFAL